MSFSNYNLNLQSASGLHACASKIYLLRRILNFKLLDIFWTNEATKVLVFNTSNNFLRAICLIGEVL